MTTKQFEVDECIEEADTFDLVLELKSRGVLPLTFDPDLTYGRTPKRDKLISYFGLSLTASLEDVLEAAKLHYNK